MKTNRAKSRASTSMKAARYLKVVEWSDEDKCFIGRCPGLFAGGVHGDDEAEVYREVCEAAAEWIEIMEADGVPLPPATSGRKYTGNFVVRVSPALHQRAALLAMSRRESLNKYVETAIEEATGVRGERKLDYAVAESPAHGFRLRSKGRRTR